MKLGYTIVYVPDVSASLVFFERAFGLRRRFLHESDAYGELEAPRSIRAESGPEIDLALMSDRQYANRSTFGAGSGTYAQGWFCHVAAVGA